MKHLYNREIHSYKKQWEIWCGIKDILVKKSSKMVKNKNVYIICNTKSVI